MVDTEVGIEAVAYVLSQEHEGKNVRQVAEECIKALRAVESTAVRQMMGPMVVGEVFRTPWMKNPMIVAHVDESDYAWLVNKADTYGLAANIRASSWNFREEARMSDPVKTRALTNVNGHKVGDLFMQNDKAYEVLATCMNGVMLKGEVINFPESNDHLHRFYSKVEV